MWLALVLDPTVRATTSGTLWESRTPGPWPALTMGGRGGDEGAVTALEFADHAYRRGLYSMRIVPRNEIRD